MSENNPRAVHYLETGSTDPCYNLAAEQYVLENKTAGDWLMLWQNDNTVVVGLNQNAAEEIDRQFVKSHGITVVRRMTGGGAVYHDLGNLNYSFISDLGNAEELSIRRFSEPVCRALASLGVQAEASGRNDILVGGRKVSGVAQRICGSRILHHGTLLFDSDLDMLSGALRADPEKFRSKSAKSARGRVANLREYLPGDVTLDDFRRKIAAELSGDGMVRETLSGGEIALIRRIADEKYRSWDWTYGKSPDYGFKNRVRCPGGTLEVRLNAHGGRISEAAFFGDFMAVEPNAPLAEALRGVRFERDEVAAVLRGFDLKPMFGAIGIGDILNCMFG